MGLAFLVSVFAVPRLEADQNKVTDCYVGVSFCGNTTQEARLLIDRVKSYSNFLIIQSGPVSWNETATNEVCEYAIAAGLKVVVYFGDLDSRFLKNQTVWRIEWVNSAKARWGNNLLGVYYYEEPGGMWIDTNWNATKYHSLQNSTYAAVAASFVNGLKNDRGMILLKNNSIPVFVSDYANQWFDYQAGYDVVLSQVGWNNSLAQDIALARGAAQMHNKDWGAMITWKYNETPYLDTGQAIYEQMVSSYEAGAKYIAIFNYPQLEINGYGVMSDEHFSALEKFWNNVVNQKVHRGITKAEVAMVLPSNYGWGMRNPQDIIWGYWGPDEKSPQIWSLSRSLLAKYGTSLDIVYDDASFSVNGVYSQVYLWNSTLPV
jgi:hypothetical protein